MAEYISHCWEIEGECGREPGWSGCLWPSREMIWWTSHLRLPSLLSSVRWWIHNCSGEWFNGSGMSVSHTVNCCTHTTIAPSQLTPTIYSLLHHVAVGDSSDSLSLARLHVGVACPHPHNTRGKNLSSSKERERERGRAANNRGVTVPRHLYQERKLSSPLRQLPVGVRTHARCSNTRDTAQTALLILEFNYTHLFMSSSHLRASFRTRNGLSLTRLL